MTPEDFKRLSAALYFVFDTYRLNGTSRVTIRRVAFEIAQAFREDYPQYAWSAFISQFGGTE
jgi:hypothetical protein